MRYLVALFLLSCSIPKAQCEWRYYKQAPGYMYEDNRVCVCTAAITHEQFEVLDDTRCQPKGAQ